MLRRLCSASPRLRRFSRAAKDAGIGLLANTALWLVSRLSLEHALQLGEQVGGLLFRVLSGARRLAIEHLEVAFGDQLSPAGREHLARASFVNVARSFCELAKIDAIRARRAEYFEVQGWAHLEGALAEGRGVIAITGRIGNWELLAAYCAWRGVPVAAIARRIYAARLNRLIVEFRSRQGVETIVRESPTSARHILRALDSNAILAMLIDQDAHAPSVPVPFFGRPARTPLAAASLAIRRNLPVVAASIHRRGDLGWRITIHPPFVIQRSGDVRADIRLLTTQFSQVLERDVRRNPAEWVWWHRRRHRAPVRRLDLDSVFQYTTEHASKRGHG